MEESSWAEIAAVSASGQASSVWSVGDEKAFLAGSETLSANIIGFNQDYLSSGLPAGITFGLTNSMNQEKFMNTMGFAGNFFDSQLCSALNEEVFSALTQDLKAVIKPVAKKSARDSDDGAIQSYVVKLFLFSEVEVSFTNTNSYQGEGTGYPYFSSQERRVKKVGDAASEWWLRSPVRRELIGGTTTTFCFVRPNGHIDRGTFTSGTAVDLGVCFGFCV